MDAEFDGIATGLSKAICKDGQQVPTANLPMGTFRHTGVGAGTARTDYARLAEVQDGTMLWGGTDTGAADAWVFALSPTVSTYVAGQMYGGKIGTSHTNTGGAATVNFGGGTKSVKTSAGGIPPAGAIVAAQSYRFLYDGTNFILQNPTLTSLTAGVVGTLPIANGGTAAVSAIAARVALGVGRPDVIVEDQKSVNTQGGTFSSGSTRTRDLNTEVFDANSYCSVATNQFTLVAGTWYIEWSTPAWKVDNHQSLLYNATDSAYQGTGTSEFSGSGGSYAQARSWGAASTIIAGSKAFEIHHVCTTTASSTGFGTAANLGSTEVYTRVLAWKVA